MIGDCNMGVTHNSVNTVSFRKASLCMCVIRFLWRSLVQKLTNTITNSLCYI